MALDSQERALIARAVKRDPEAFSQLYVNYYDQVLRRVSSIVRNRNEAEDITSEAFLRAWNAISRFEPRDVSIVAWFSTIAERLAVKHMKNRRPSVAVDDVVLGAPQSHSPEARVEKASELATLQSALENLPDTQREIVAMHFLQELSFTEVGLATGKSVGTVRVIKHRALKTLRAILTSRQEEQGQPPFVRRPTTPAKITR